MMEKVKAPHKKIVLVGNPNSGKTTLFNALTGSHQRVGNWSGVTVEQKRGVVQGSKEHLILIDLPGTYAVHQPQTECALDEQMTAQYLTHGDYDCILNIVDAANIERNLFLTTQLLERDLPVVVAVNRTDLLGQHTELDCKALSQRLGCPVIPVSATQKEGIQTLIESLNEETPQPSFSLTYPESVENELKRLEGLGFTHREILGYFEGMPLEGEPKMGDVLKSIQTIKAQDGFEPDILLAQTRFNWIEQTLAHALRSLSATSKPIEKITQTLDAVILHRFWGIPVFLGIMYALFFFAINVGGALQDFFDMTSSLIFVEGTQALCRALALPDLLTAMMSYGFGKGLNTVLTFVPVIGAMFFALSFLEDSGYMARAAFVMDRLMRTMGLPGKSFVPLIVGFGCNVPAIMGSRTLERQRDRILTVMISPFMSCGARLAIFTLFVAAFFPHHGSNIVFLLYLIGIFMAVFTGLILKKTLLRGEPEPLVLELPAYQWPTWTNLSFHAWHRLKRFILNAGKLIIPICMLIGSLNTVTVDFKIKTQPEQTSLLARAGQAVTPVFTPMGIEQDNWPATVGLFTGVMAKEVVIGTLNALYAQEGGLESQTETPLEAKEAFIEALKTIPQNLSQLTQAFANPIESAAPEEEMTGSIFGEMQSRFNGSAAAFAYLIFVLLYFPCVSASAAMLKEVQKKWTLFSMGWTTLVAYSSAVIFFQAATLPEHQFSSMAWIVAMISLLSLVVFALGMYKDQKPLPTRITVSS